MIELENDVCTGKLNLSAEGNNLRYRKLHIDKNVTQTAGHTSSGDQDCNFLDCEMTEVIKSGIYSNDIDLGSLAHDAKEQAEEFVRKVWEACNFSSLPQWLQHNDFLYTGHRPPLKSFKECFKSIFRIHTETGNIWTHLIGCLAFICAAIYFTMQSHLEVTAEEKMVIGIFFAGAIICLGMSTTCHTLNCHSECVGRLFSKLDYCGISLLIMGSFVPWLYYGFYCYYHPKLIYLTTVVILGITSIIISMREKFSEPKYRSLRAGVFMGFGFSAIVPAIHCVITEGWLIAFTQTAFGWFLFMGFLYSSGTIIYALRIPERYFPGKFDIWFQSHQIFHVFVVAAAFAHYYGILEMATHRLSIGDCMVSQQIPIY